MKLEIDPLIFRPEAISEETNASIEMLEALLKNAPSVMDLGAAKTRELRENGEGLLAKEPASEIAQWREAEALGRKVRVRVFTPETIRGVYLHIHGGGHALGSADAQDQTLEDFAKALNVAVVSVEYRLAPENPWPAGPDDCEAAALWLVENSKALFGADKIIIGGESAGAHLSAVTLLRMRDHHGYADFSGANLVYGIYDMTMTPSLQNWGDRNLIINTPIVKWFGDQLFPSQDYGWETKRSAAISPLYADLHDMPPALFTIGTLDPVLDDSIFMAHRWVQFDADAELAIYPGGIHAFDCFPIALARQARERMIRFMDQQFA